MSCRKGGPLPLKGRECTKCGEWKPREAFHKHKQCPGGINTVCKKCRVPLSKAGWAAMPREAHILQRARGRAKKKGLPCTITVEDIVIPNVCPVLGTPMHRPSIDQHRPAEGYTPDNIVIMSTRANTLKNNGTLEEFKLLVKYLERLGE